MRKGIQDLYKSLGSSGCYFLSLLDLAQEYNKCEDYNPIDVAIRAATNGYVDIDFKRLGSESNFYVNRPDLLLGMLTHATWTVRKEPANYKVKSDEYVIIQYEYQGYTHFVRPNFDSLQNSRTARLGKINSYRVFKVI